MTSYPTFYPAHEKDYNPAISPEAEKYYQLARSLEKKHNPLYWPTIIENYQQAIELNHWKAMNNLAYLYYKGIPDPNGNFQGPSGVEKNIYKSLKLYIQMVQLEVPIGYYNWGIALEQELVPNQDPRAASAFMFKAACMGSPLAQVKLGNFFAYGLPKHQQRNDLAEQYFHCAGEQDNPKALLEVADFYDIVKQNKPRALFYYQKAAALGDSSSLLFLSMVFSENATDIYNFGYLPDPNLSSLYYEMHEQLKTAPDLKFPNLITDYPIPRHPTQGYDADNPDIRP